VRPYFKNNQSQKSWRHGSSGREPAKQVQSPEFKPQYHKKKKPNFKGTPLYLDYSKRSHGVIGPNLIDLCKYTLMFAKDEIA
jgi:hypothetical protein